MFAWDSQSGNWGILKSKAALGNLELFGLFGASANILAQIDAANADVAFMPYPFLPHIGAAKF